MTTEQPRSVLQRLRQRCSDWLWFVLTRDLHPRRQPSRIRSLVLLLSDAIWYARWLFRSDKQE